METFGRPKSGKKPLGQEAKKQAAERRAHRTPAARKKLAATLAVKTAEDKRLAEQVEANRLATVAAAKEKADAQAKVDADAAAALAAATPVPTPEPATTPDPATPPTE